MKNYYVFEGFNATTGAPNRRTGKHSFYGDILSFESKELALQYVADKDPESLPTDRSLVVGTRRKMREFRLGSTMQDFNTDMDMLDSMPTQKVNGKWENFKLK